MVDIPTLRPKRPKPTLSLFCLLNAKRTSTLVTDPNGLLSGRTQAATPFPDRQGRSCHQKMKFKERGSVLTHTGSLRERSDRE